MSLEQFEIYEKFYVIDKLGVKHRAMREDDDTVFVFGYRKQRYGRRIDNATLLRDYEIVIKKGKSHEKRRMQTIHTIIYRLRKSGLWPEIRSQYEDLLKIAYEDWKEMRQILTENDPKESYQETVQKRYARLQPYAKKYPFAFTMNGNKYSLDTFFVYEMSDPKLKSMYFGKGWNENVKNRIKEALNNKTECKEFGRASYDVSFEYDPEDRKAWYREEYKGTANGHYYIALDHNTALFVEND